MPDDGSCIIRGGKDKKFKNEVKKKNGTRDQEVFRWRNSLK